MAIVGDHKRLTARNYQYNVMSTVVMVVMGLGLQNVVLLLVLVDVKDLIVLIVTRSVNYVNINCFKPYIAVSIMYCNLRCYCFH